MEKQIKTVIKNGLTAEKLAIIIALHRHSMAIQYPVKEDKKHEQN